jgi:tripartite-type tricarboxylate transporter receptor subunit TctC
MMLPRRGLIAASIGLAAPAFSPAGAQEAYPSRPVNVVVPWGPGGPTDAFARVLSQRLSTDLGQPFLVDNRVGANGTIGMAFAARARPDGYTVVIAPNSTYAVAPHLYQLSYNNDRDFVGVGLLVSMPIFMLVHRNSPATTVAEYVALARRPNSRLTYANASVGATSHLATEMLLQSAGIEVLEVNYRGGGPAVQAVVAGEAGMVFMPAAAVMGFINSGELRALGVASATRSPLAPNVPTFREQGFPDVEIVEHVAMLAPAGTPQPILERLNAASRAALRAPEIQPRLDALAVTAETRPLAEWPAYAAAESAKWGAVVRARNIRVQ